MISPVRSSTPDPVHRPFGRRSGGARERRRARGVESAGIRGFMGSLWPALVTTAVALAFLLAAGPGVDADSTGQAVTGGAREPSRESAHRDAKEGQGGQVLLDIEEGMIAGGAHVHQGALFHPVVLLLDP